MARAFKDYRNALKERREAERREAQAQAISEAKQQALETLEKVKRIYDEEGGDLLTGGLWADFMQEVNAQIKEIEETTI